MHSPVGKNVHHFPSLEKVKAGDLIRQRPPTARSYSAGVVDSARRDGAGQEPGADYPMPCDTLSNCMIRLRQKLRHPRKKSPTISEMAQSSMKENTRERGVNTTNKNHSSSKNGNQTSTVHLPRIKKKGLPREVLPLPSPERSPLLKGATTTPER